MGQDLDKKDLAVFMDATAGLMTTKQAAAYLGKSPEWIWHNRERLGMPYVPIGGRYHFRKQSLDLWISSCEVNSAEPSLARKETKRSREKTMRINFN
jgi:predicted DNA-binding transcriptional regulator AlpA